MSRQAAHLSGGPGDALRQWRLVRKHTYRSLAALVPCDHGLLWKIERGRASLTPGMARTCDELLNTSGALVAALTAWRSSDADTVVLPPAQLPPVGARLVGRQAELEMLDHGAFHGSSGTGKRSIVIAIDGPAGAGKTALALHWAHHVSRQFEDGQLYADLGGFGESADAVSVDDVMRSFLSALGSRSVPTRSDDLAAQYRSTAARRRLLIVLDNVPDANTVERLLPAASGCCVVVTSRHDLRRLVTREGATRVTVGPLSQPDSLGMMRRIIGRRADSETASLESIAEMSGRLPLALRAVAEQIAIDSHRSITDLVDDLQAAGASLLDMLDLIDLRRSFSWTYKRLPEDTTQVLRAAALLGSESVHLGAIAALAGTTQARIRQLVLKATEVHLVDLGADNMVRMQPLVRDYLRDQADDTIGATTRISAIQRLVSWYAATAREASPRLPSRRNSPVDASHVLGQVEPLHFADSTAAKAWIEAEATNLTRAVTLAADYGPAGTAQRLQEVLAGLGLPHITIDRPADAASDEALAETDEAVELLIDNRESRLSSDHLLDDRRRSTALALLAEWGSFGRRATDRLWADVCCYVNGDNGTTPGLGRRRVCASATDVSGCPAVSAK